MAKDHELDWLLTRLEAIKLRSSGYASQSVADHPGALLLNWCRFDQSSANFVGEPYVNHANEVDGAFCAAMKKLRHVGVTSQPRRTSCCVA